MSPAVVLSPVFVQAFLTLGLLLATGAMRFAATKARQVRLKDVALGQDGWPARVTQIGRAYQNQIEAPTLFYAAVALALAVGLTDRVFVALEWIFVALRLGHAYVHVTSNHVPTRFFIFAMGVVALLAMWIWLALRAYGWV
jgi:hypothetical protein